MHEPDESIKVSATVAATITHSRRWLIGIGAGGAVISTIAGVSASGRPRRDGATPGAVATTPNRANHASPDPEPAIPDASVFMMLRNTGERPDRLIGATSDVAGHIVLRTFDDATGVRTEHLQPVDVPIAGGETITLAPGEPQLMLHDLRRVLPPNTWFALRLAFERAGEIEIPVNVRWGGAPIVTDINRANRYSSGDMTVIEPWAFPVGQAEIVTPIPATPGATPDVQATPAMPVSSSRTKGARS